MLGVATIEKMYGTIDNFYAQTKKTKKKGFFSRLWSGIKSLGKAVWKGVKIAAVGLAAFYGYMHPIIGGLAGLASGWAGKAIGGPIGNALATVGGMLTLGATVATGKWIWKHRATAAAIIAVGKDTLGALWDVGTSGFRALRWIMGGAGGQFDLTLGGSVF